MEPYLLALVLAVALGFSYWLLARELTRERQRTAALQLTIDEYVRAQLDLPPPATESGQDTVILPPLPDQVEAYLRGIEDIEARETQREYFAHRVLTEPDVDPDDLLDEALIY